MFLNNTILVFLYQDHVMCRTRPYVGRVTFYGSSWQTGRTWDRRFTVGTVVSASWASTRTSTTSQSTADSPATSTSRYAAWVRYLTLPPLAAARRTCCAVWMTPAEGRTSRYARWRWASTSWPPGRCFPGSRPSCDTLTIDPWPATTGRTPTPPSHQKVTWLVNMSLM